MLRLAAILCLVASAGAAGQPAPRADAAPRTSAPRAEASRAAGASPCGSKRYCREMTSCAEAYFHLQACGLLRLDADRDGVPCEISHCPHTR